MATLLLLTNAMTPSADVLPALGLLGHSVRVAPLEVAALLSAPAHDAVLVDARRDLAGARSLCRVLRTTGVAAPMFVVLTEGGLVALTADWGWTISCCTPPDRPRSRRGCGWRSAASRRAARSTPESYAPAT